RRSSITGRGFRPRVGPRSSDLEPQGLREKFLEWSGVPAGCPELQFRVAPGADLQQVVLAPVAQIEAGDRLRVASVKALREPENRGERLHDCTPLSGQIAKSVVTRFRYRSPMIPRDERHRLDLVGLESAEIAVLDQVVGVFVVAFVADVYPDIVQDG